MYRFRTTMFLSLLLGLLSPALSHADIWRCPQAEGPDLFTDTLKDPRTCQKYELGADINFVPSSSTTMLPDVVPYQPMPVAEPPALPETPREVTEPYTAVGGEQEPYDSIYPYYPYSGGYLFPFILGSPRRHHSHHHGLSSSHGVMGHSSGHGGGHGGHR